MSETVFTNAVLVLPEGTMQGSLHVVDGKIADITDSPSRVAGHIDCGGAFLIPGLIELHTDNLERHLQPRPGVNWPHLQAILAHDAELAATGITTVYDALRVGSITSSGRGGYGEYARALADEILAVQTLGAFKISHFLHLRAEVCSETLVAELERFTPQDRVGIISLMDHTPGQRQFADLAQLRRYMRGKYGLTEDEFLAHVEAQTILGNRVRASHEAAAVAAAQRLGAVLASHDDTTADHVTQSAAHGARLAEFPTTLDAATACQAQGIAVIMGAPNLIRGGSHSGNVAAQDLAQAGLLDVLSSDYVPAALLQGAFMLGDMLGNLAQGIATVTRAPAKAVGLADRGQLALGTRADLVQVHRYGKVPAVRGVWVAGQRVG
jgi:alpha-D-ribose 1-methylphosphonate 5-triphosphate diphosphatase